MGTNTLAREGTQSQGVDGSEGHAFGALDASHPKTKSTDVNLANSVVSVGQQDSSSQPLKREEPNTIQDPLVVPASAMMVQEAASDPQSPDLPDQATAKQEPAAAGPAISGEITVANLLSEIERQKAAVTSDEQVDEMQKADRLEMLANAQGSLLKTANFRLKRDEYEKQLAEYPAALQNLEQELAKQLQGQSPDIPAGSTAVELDSELQRLQRELAEQEKLLVDLETENKDLSQRVTEIPEIRATTSEELGKAKERLATISDSTDDLNAHISWLLQIAKKISFETQLQMLDAEIERQKLAGKVLPLKRDRTSRLIKRLKADIAVYETAIADLRRQEVQNQARQARLEAIYAHPALKDIATRNQELTQLRSNITGRIQSANAEMSELGTHIDSLRHKKQDLESKIRQVGATNANNGMLLVQSRRSLGSTSESQIRIKEIQVEQQSVTIALFSLEEERKSLADPAEFVAKELGKVADQVIDGEPLSAMATKFVQTKRQYLDDLINDYNQYLGLLAQLTVDRKKQIDQINEIRDYIDENALWVRNADPLSMNDLAGSAAGLASFFAPQPWAEMGANFANRIAKRPYESVLGMGGVLVLIIFTRRLKHN
jgi:chromosome segregation ATPase